MIPVERDTCEHCGASIMRNPRSLMGPEWMHYGQAVAGARGYTTYWDYCRLTRATPK